MTTLQREDVLQLRGQDLTDRDGDTIGKVEEIYLDVDTDQPEWALVNTGMFGTKSTFVPLKDATREGDKLRVPFEKSQVKDAPRVDPDGQLSQREEAELYRHYGLEYTESQSGSGLPEGGAGVTTGTGTETGTGDAAGTVGHDVSGPTTDDAMTRSEEEVKVGTTERESGRARLRKYVVEEEVTKTVPVRREEVRIEREPVTEGNAGAALDGPAISEEEHEVVLHEEEPVVEKQAVPKERVRLDKETITDEAEVSETARKEQIEIDEGRG
jgi:uncharacterized protein (TIGR02271 family)